MARLQKPCATCGKPCWGQHCRGCGWAAVPKCERRCVTCGAPFIAQNDRPSREPAKYCSLPCVAAALRKSPTLACEMCGAKFARKPSDVARKGGRFCSRPCADEAKRTGRKPSKSKPKQPLSEIRSLVCFPSCKHCGAVFCARRKGQKYCSDLCRARRNIDRTMGLYELATQFDKETGRYAGAEWRRVLLDYLVQRDGDRCAICNRKVDLSLKSGPKGSRSGPSVDHIIPRSKGGSDDPVNLRLTHWGCNQVRGNRGGGEQLALVG